MTFGVTNETFDRFGASLAGPRVTENGFVPDGDHAYLMGGWTGTLMLIVPSYNRYGERTGIAALTKQPLWTRHMLGVQDRT